MRLLIIRLFILLGLFFPALASAQIASYVGSYSGTFSGGDSGTWAVTVLSTGGVTGTSYSNSSGLNYTVSGQALSDGSLAMTAGTTSSGATFTGSINLATGGVSGTWSNSYYGISGTFTGTGATSKASQSIGAISFSPTTLTVGGATTAGATATSGLAVSFSSATPSVCSISGSIVTGVAVGTCTIAADQAGNANYNAATQVTQSFSVSAQAAPAVSLSPASLTFTNQSTGVTSAAQTVILTNSGTAVLSIAGIAASSEFAQTNNCGAGVAAGASCTLTITSTPTIAGVRTGTVTITSDAASSPSIISVASVPAGALSFVPGWNLVGNSVNAPLDVAATLGDATKVQTVWKWIPATSKWAFYTPTIADGGIAYAATKGYDVLASITGGEGFWVNAKMAFTAQLPAGTAISTNTFADQLTPPNNLPTGWSLVAVGDNPAPRNFVNAIAISQPVAPAVAATSLTTLWAWDSGLSSWYFYAPSLDNNGTLANYITTKGYLNFGAKTLDPAMGFWVNHP